MLNASINRIQSNVFLLDMSMKQNQTECFCQLKTIGNIKSAMLVGCGYKDELKCR